MSVAIPKPLEMTFDYELPDGLATPDLGSRLRVPFGKGESIGICIEFKEQSNLGTLREIKEVIDNDALVSSDLIALALWMANYYHHPVGETLFSIIPREIRKGKPLQLDKPKSDEVQ